MASQALLKAVTSARFTQTRLLLNMKADVNCQDWKGQTPLIRALFLQDPRVRTSFLRLLLRSGALVSRSDDENRNALMWACDVTTYKDVVLLLQHADMDLNINAQSEDGRTAVWLAVDAGKTEVVRELLQLLSKDRLSFEIPDHEGVTPAMRAAMLGHVDCLRVMVECLATSYTMFANVTQMKRILKSLSATGMPEIQPQGLQVDRNCGRNPELPAIRITPCTGEHGLIHKAHRRPSKQLRCNPVISVDFLPDPVGRSTPLSPNYKLAPCPSSSPRPSLGKFSPVPVRCGSAEHEFNSLHLAPKKHLWLGENRNPQNKAHLNNVVNDWELSGSTLNLSSSQGGHSGDVLTPVGKVATSRDSTTSTTSSTVRDSLPGLFDIIAQQTSGSFRKTAVKPPTPVKRRRPVPMGRWSKLRGIALISGCLGKAAAVSKMRKTSHLPQPDGLPVTVTKALNSNVLAKRKRSVVLKQHVE